MQILIATEKSGNQATKTYDLCFEIFSLLFSRGSGVVSFHGYVSVLALVQIFIIFL